MRRVLFVGCMISLLAATWAGAVAVPAALAAQTVITSSGPLTSIFLQDDLACQVNYGTDAHGEFYGGSDPGACGTFLSTGGNSYGPNDIPAGTNNRSPYQLVSQTGPTGSGTSADPYKVATVVGVLGPSENLLATITQTDTYVTGDEFYRTDIQVHNETASTLSATLYHAADCYLQDSDVGYGFHNSTRGDIDCTQNAGNSPPGRIEGFIPLDSGSSFYESTYSNVWNAIVAAGTQFPNTVDTTVNEDNGAGLSWPLSIVGNGSATRSLLTAFSTTGADLSITKTDSPDPVQAGQNLTYSITVHNGGPAVATGVQVSDPLPAGVTFVSSSSDQGPCSGTSTVTCSIGSMASGADVHLTITVTPNGGGSLSNTASVSSSTFDFNPDNDSATATTTVLPGAATVSELPPPDAFSTANLDPVSGTVLVKLPGTDNFIPIADATQIPLGTLVDVTDGRVALTAAKDQNGATESGDFFGGVFKLVQVNGKDANGKPIIITKLILVDQGAPSGRVLARGRHKHLWGSGKGNFQTQGHLGSATVRGTKWLTADSAAGTLIKVVHGVVLVHDFVRHKVITVTGGHKVLIRPPGKPAGHVHRSG